MIVMAATNIPDFRFPSGKKSSAPLGKEPQDYDYVKPEDRQKPVAKDHVTVFILLKLKIPDEMLKNSDNASADEVLLRKVLIKDKVCKKISELENVRVQFSLVFT